MKYVHNKSKHILQIIPYISIHVFPMHIIYMVYTIYNSYLTLVGIPAKGWNQAFQLNWPMMSHMGSHMELEADLRVTWTPRIPIFETPVALSQNYALLNNHHHAIFGAFFRKLEETQGTSGCRGCLSKLPAFLTNHFGVHPLWNRKAMGMNKACKEFWMGGNMNTLQEINISHQTGIRKIIFKMPIFGGYVSSLEGIHTFVRFLLEGFIPRMDGPIGKMIPNLQPIRNDLDRIPGLHFCTKNVGKKYLHGELTARP